MTLDRIDFLRRELRVDRQVVTPSAGVPAFGPPKTNGSYRMIPLADVVVEQLAEHVRQYGTGVDGVLLHRDGVLVGRNRFGDLWRATVGRAGLPGVRMHDLRHTYASTMLSQGVSIAAVAGWLGHDSPATTLKVYAHFMPEDADRGRVAIDRAWSRKPVEDYLRTATHQN